MSCPYNELPTAFIAEYGYGKITIAFIAEYDALPGYGENGEPAHACGHNWIAATMIGCGIILSRFANEIGCRVKVIGTPAEESFGGKYDMCQHGAFDDVDVAFQAHLDENNCMESIQLAMNSMQFTFHGKSAHASQYPEQGINALDGVIQMFNGINAIRQHLSDDVRIHGIITQGGDAANIVPNFAQCRFSFRSQDKRHLKSLRTKIINIADGAALMTGTSMEYEDYENPFDDMKNLKTLSTVTLKHFQQVGIENFLSREDYIAPGSSDIGNVSYVCPTLYAELNLEGEKPLHVHDKIALELVNSPAAYKKCDKLSRHSLKLQ